MHNIFTIIKKWIILQMTRLKAWWLSLFTKELPEESSEHSTTSDSTQVSTLLQQDEIDGDKILKKDLGVTNTISLEDREFDVTINDHQDVHSQPKDIPNQQQKIPLYDGKYDNYFHTQEISVPLSVVDEKIWDVLQMKLPIHYTIPAAESKKLYS